MLELHRIDRGAPLDESAFNYCLFASGFEARATAVAARVRWPDRVTIWAFDDHISEASRPRNDSFYEEHGVKTVLLPGSDDDAADRAARELVAGLPEEGGRLLIDISSMTRSWYGALIRALVNTPALRQVEVTWAYTPGAYRPPPAGRAPNEIIGPVRGFTGLSLPDEPTTLLLGLGYEPGRGMGVHSEIDPTATVCFYADPGTDPRFVSDLFHANDDLSRSLGNSGWRRYPLDDPFYTFHLVDAACNALHRRGPVVLTNNGPKIFGLICFLVALRFRNASVWRISSGLAGEPLDRHPAGPPHCLRTVWTQVEMADEPQPPFWVSPAAPHVALT